MAHHFIDTPRTDAADRTRFDTTIGDVSFGVAEPSFVPLDGRNDLLGAMRSKSGAATLATPRIPLASKRNIPQVRQEFTPLLRSATKNAMRVRGIDGKENNHGKLRTPAALRPGFQLSSPNIPEVSEFGSSGLHSNDNDGDRTPAAPGIESSSIDISTLQALPKGDLGMDGGNMLTLKEQENKLEQIDKENFGLKLKIHYLEEALGKTGSEYQQQMTRDHVELQAGKIVMERELKRYKKMLVDAERNLELYRQQLLEYTEKVKRRHEDEIASEALSRVQQLADAREEEIQKLKRQIQESESQEGNEQVEKLRDELDLLEAELEGKERDLEQKEEELDALHAKVKAASGDLDVELDERDRRIEAQADELDQLRDQIAKLERERDEEENPLQEKLDAAKEEHAAELDDLRNQLELAQRDKREQLRNFESRLQTYEREKRAELEATQRKLESLEKEKASEIESLELRLKLAESKGDNQSQLAQQAAVDAQERLKIVTQEKEDEIESLRSQINTFEGIQDELDTCQKRLHDYAEDVNHRHEEESRKEELISQLRQTVQDKDRELRNTRSTLQDQDAITHELNKLRTTVGERDREIAILKQKNEAQAVDLEDLKVAQTRIVDLKREVENLKQTLTERQAELEVLRRANEEPDSQLEGLQSIVRHRDGDLQDLRQTLSVKEKELEAVKSIAEERFQQLEQLRKELSTTRTDLEDEIAVLEAQIDEAEADKEELNEMIARLEKESKESFEAQAKMSPLRKELRITEREKVRLQERLDVMEKQQDDTDKERSSLQQTIALLRKDLKDAQSARSTSSPVRKELKAAEAQIASLRDDLKRKTNDLADVKAKLAMTDNDDCINLDKPTLNKKHAEELKNLNDMLKQSALECESLRLELAQKQKIAAADVTALRKELATKERQLTDLEEMSHRHVSAQAKMQDTRMEVGRLQTLLAEVEKRHAKEIRGLVKTVTFLRAKSDREEKFREGLGWQKRWFLLMVDMYGRYNRMDLRLLEEIGITPDLEMRERAKRPRLRTVVWALIFCERARKAAELWREKKIVQDALVRKVELMRGRQVEGKRVMHVYR